MRAAIYRGPGEIEADDVPKPEIEAPTDAVVCVTHTAICGSDLWFYRELSDREEGSRVGHEPMGIVEAVDKDVRSVEPGDRVLAPFVISCGTCEFCRKGLHTSCVNGDSWNGTTGVHRGSTSGRCTPTGRLSGCRTAMPTTRRRSARCCR